MKRLNATAALAAALMLAVSFGPAASADGRVLGEKLDSGLGTMVYGEKLDSGLGTMVYGESLDSGLGDLPATYSAAEFMPAGPAHAASEPMPIVVTAGRAEER